MQIELADGVVYVHTIIMRAFCDHFKTLLDENWSNGRLRLFYVYDLKMCCPFCKLISLYVYSCYWFIERSHQVTLHKNQTNKYFGGFYIPT